MSEPQSESLWAAASRIYSDQDVMRRCLALQDACQADVNLLLYLLWRAQSQLAMGLEELHHAVEATRGWRETVICKLREARGSVKRERAQRADPYLDRIYGLVRDAEILSERVELELLEQLQLPEEARLQLESREEAARISFKNYATLLTPAPLASDLEGLIAAAGRAPKAV